MSEEAGSPTKKKATAKKAIVKKVAEHPKYIEMVCCAIQTLKERGGSSRQAIIKYICANYPLGDSCGTHVKVCLRRGVANCTLLQTKGKGASGSFKVAEKAKPKTKKATKKAATPKKAVKKSTTPKKKSAAKKSTKKPAAKKPAAKKAVAKKPAAKKPAAKKTAKKGKKAAAKKGTKK